MSSDDSALCNYIATFSHVTYGETTASLFTATAYNMLLSIPFVAVTRRCTHLLCIGHACLTDAGFFYFGTMSTIKLAVNVLVCVGHFIGTTQTAQPSLPQVSAWVKLLFDQLRNALTRERMHLKGRLTLLQLFAPRTSLRWNYRLCEGLVIAFLCLRLCVSFAVFPRQWFLGCLRFPPFPPYSLSHLSLSNPFARSGSLPHSCVDRLSGMSVVPYYDTTSRDVGRFSSGSSHRGGSCLVSRNFFPSQGTWKRDSFDDCFGGDYFHDIFSRTRSLFGQMDRMMSSVMREPFSGDPFFRSTSYPSLMAPLNTNTGPSDPFGFSNFGSLVPSMESMAREGSCHSYSSSSVMTMTTGLDGRPQAPIIMQKTDANSCRWQERASQGLQVYQASSSTHDVPGGVRETRRSVADSSSGLRKMAVGHHIGDRSHVIEKEMGREGDVEERQEFVNLDEEEAPNFNHEFRRRTQQAYGALEHRPRFRTERPSASSPSRQRYLPALPASSRTSLDSYRRRTRPTLAITSGSRVEERTRHRDRGSTRARRHQ